MKHILTFFLALAFHIKAYSQSTLKIDSLFQDMVDRPEFHNLFSDTLRVLELKSPDLPSGKKVYYIRPADKAGSWKNVSHARVKKISKIVYKLNGKVKKKKRKISVTVIYTELIDRTNEKTFSMSIHYTLKYKKTKSGWRVNKNKHHNMHLLGKPVN